MAAPHLENLLDPLLLAQILAGDLVDLEPGFGSHALGVGPDLVLQRCGETGEVEDPDPPARELPAHRPGVADVGQCARAHHRVEAPQHTLELSLVPLDEPDQDAHCAGGSDHERPCYPAEAPTGSLFGSDYAGVGTAVFSFASLPHLLRCLLTLPQVLPVSLE